MVKFIVRFLISQLTPQDLIDLGSALRTAGIAAQNKQIAINTALAHVNAGVAKLTQ